MKAKKALGAGLVGLSLPGLAALMLIAPGANANDAAVTSTVTTEEECGWRLMGAPGAFELNEADGAEYVGSALSISAAFTDSSTNTLNLYVSGTDQAANSRTLSSECTFYENAAGSKKRPIVNMKVAGAFASSPDTSMSFTPGVGGAANVTVTATGADATACEADSFVVEDLSLVAGNTPTLTGDFLEMLIDNVSGTAAEDLGQRCDLGFTIAATIPGGIKPTDPGEDYSWAGLTLTTTLSTDTDDTDGN